MLTRRSLLESALKISAGLALSPCGLADSSPLLTLKLSKRPSVPVPANFIGLGYEMSSVARLGLLSAANRRYVELIKGLGPEGVLRVGGIVADYSRYEPNGNILTEPHNTVIAKASVEQFATFLREIGWSAIWSVNFAQGTLANAVDEARAVALALGSRLLAFEIGNEVEFYSRGDKPFRKPPYDYATYRAEYNQWRAAILRAVPGARFAAPDTATSVEWVERMAMDAKGDVQLLTTHYYYRGAQNNGTAEQLLRPDPRLMDVLTRMRSASRQSGIPWRMCETNSFSGGGRPGVSDTFTGTLWTLDFLLLLAVYGCSGVNIETGVNQLGFISSYSPIQDDGKGVNSAGAPYYAMLAFAEARRGCTEAMMIDGLQAADNITAYALGTAGRARSAVIVNRGASPALISVEKLGLDSRLNAMRLEAPSGDSRTGVTLAGSSVEASGKWSPTRIERVLDSRMQIAGMSGVILTS